jgi:hypothetical protein
MDSNAPVKYILFLNLEYVIINDVRTYTHALLLEEGPHVFGGVKRQLRGFGLDPSWCIFDIQVPSIEYTLTDAQSNAVIFSASNPQGRPMASGAIMDLKDGPSVQLLVNDQKHPLDIKTFEGTWGDKFTIDEVWAYLTSRAPHYWNAPGIPTLQWGHNPHFRGYGR